MIFCQWGNHYVLPVGHVNETFDQGSMCLECQIKIVENVTKSVPMPEVTAALHARETRKRQERLEREGTERRVKAGDPNAPGYVYYIRINGQIKIGYAADVTARMRHYPPQSELLAVEAGTFHTEQERHQHFRRFKVRGREWFDESPELTAWITHLVDVFGKPDALAYEYTKPRTTPL